jgi:hypothetical protein
MTNLEKLKAWQEKEIAQGLNDVKLTAIPGKRLVDAAIEKIVSGECKRTEDVTDEEIEKAAGDLLALLECKDSVDITNAIF